MNTACDGWYINVEHFGISRASAINKGAVPRLEARRLPHCNQKQTVSAERDPPSSIELSANVKRKDEDVERCKCLAIG